MAIGSVIVQGQLLGSEGLALRGDKTLTLRWTLVLLSTTQASGVREAMRAMDGIGEDGETRIMIGHMKNGSSMGIMIIALLAAQQVVPNSSHL